MSVCVCVYVCACVHVCLLVCLCMCLLLDRVVVVQEMLEKDIRDVTSYYYLWKKSPMFQRWKFLRGQIEREDLENITDLNNKTCTICKDWGDLICCEACPQSFHMRCLNMDHAPEGTWVCPDCAKVREESIP